MPFDNVKTKVQKMTADEHGNFPYKGFADCFSKTLKNEGVRGFYVGFPTFFTRVAPHAIVSLLVIDFLKGIATKK